MYACVSIHEGDPKRSCSIQSIGASVGHPPRSCTLRSTDRNARNARHVRRDPRTPLVGHAALQSLIRTQPTRGTPTPEIAPRRSSMLSTVKGASPGSAKEAA